MVGEKIVFIKTNVPP